MSQAPWIRADSAPHVIRLECDTQHSRGEIVYFKRDGELSIRVDEKEDGSSGWVGGLDLDLLRNALDQIAKESSL